MALVEAHRHVNGYFIVAEYPIVTVNRRGVFVKAVQRSEPALVCPSDRPNMLIAEVKRGQTAPDPECY